MNTESIKKELIGLVSTLFADNGFDVDMIEYADLIDDLGMDSITFITIVVEIEAHFGIEVTDEMLLIDNFKNVDNIVNIIVNELDSKKVNGAEIRHKNEV